MYREPVCVVKLGGGESEGFEVGTGLHQGSALSPLLFVLLLDEASKAVRSGLSWKVGFADDLAIGAESRSKLEGSCGRWFQAMASVGLVVNEEKTVVMKTWRKGGVSVAPLAVPLLCVSQVSGSEFCSVYPVQRLDA